MRGDQPNERIEAGRLAAAKARCRVMLCVLCRIVPVAVGGGDLRGGRTDATFRAEQAP